MADYLEINPTVTVHELLETYPQLENVLIELAPPFKKLNNPMLRRSVAKVATLKHIAVVGGIPLDDLVDKLREAAGQSSRHEHYEDDLWDFDNLSKNEPYQIRSDYYRPYDSEYESSYN